MRRDADAARLQFAALDRLVGKHNQDAWVSRMTDKGVLRFEGERPRLYYPGIQKEDAAFSETQQLLSRAFGGNFGLLMSNFIDNAKLSKGDLEELYDMLRQAEDSL